MSGIFGVFFRDGRPVSGTILREMQAVLQHRGPDGGAAWASGSVGMGHLMLHTTPESLYEEQPYVVSDGKLALVADARVDNRDELIKTLGLSSEAPDRVTDSALILASYEKWGEECPARIVGAFAFGIWDGRRRSWFCARDHMGIRPFYYYISPQVFVFASEIKALHCLPEVPRRLNELRIAVHLVRTVSDNALTYYQDIERLRPAHSLTVSSDQHRQRVYWSLDPNREIRLNSDEDYSEAFAEIFTEAVRCRLRSAFSIGSMLSGGLDSSAVTCVARRLLLQSNGDPLHTISAVFDAVPEADESNYINLLLEEVDSIHHDVAMSPISPLVEMERIHALGDEPVMSLTQYLSWGLNGVAKEQGIRVTLDGLDGDTAVSHGDGYLSELARSGRWPNFADEANAISQHENLPSRGALMRQYAFPYLRELARSGRWITFARQAGAVSTHLELPYRYLFWNHGLRVALPARLLGAARGLRGKPRVRNDRQEDLLRHDFLDRVGLMAHLESNSSLPRTEREEHYQALSSPLQPYAFELAGRTGMAFGIESRHPFTDRRLLEFCLALPPEQKLSQGWGRLVLRRAMEGIMPEAIRWRGGKTVNSAAITCALLTHERRRMDEIILGDLGIVEPYVNLRSLRETYRRYLDQKRMVDELTVWQVLSLVLWMQQANIGP